MLPPWLSESEVAATGYEAPVENLPQDEVIPEQKGGRGLFGRRRPRKDAPREPTAPPAANPAPTSGGAEPNPWASQPATPMPTRDPGTHFNLPHRGDQSGSANQQSNGHNTRPPQPSGHGPAQPPNGQTPTQLPQNGQRPAPAPHNGQGPNGQGFGGTPHPGQAPNLPQGPRFDIPPANGGQPGHPAAPEPARPGPHSGPIGPTPGPQFSPPPTPPVDPTQRIPSAEPARPAPHPGPLGPVQSPQFSTPPTPPAEPMDPAALSAPAPPQQAKPDFTPPPLPSSPNSPQGPSAAETHPRGASLAGASAAGTPGPANPARPPADPATRAPLPPSPGEVDSAANDPAFRAARPPLPPSPGEAGTAADPADATTKMAHPPLPPAPGDLDATGSGIIAPAAPTTRTPIPPAHETGPAAGQSDSHQPDDANRTDSDQAAIPGRRDTDNGLGDPQEAGGQRPPADLTTRIPNPSAANDAAPVPNTTAATHELLEAQPAGLTGAPAEGEQAYPKADFDQSMVPGRHRAVEGPLPLPSDPQLGGPIPPEQQGSSAASAHGQRDGRPPLPARHGTTPPPSAAGPQGPSPIGEIPGAAPQGTGPIPQVPAPGPQGAGPLAQGAGAGPLPHVPVPGAQMSGNDGQWMPPAPPVPGPMPGMQGMPPAADSGVPVMHPHPGFPAGLVPPQPNPWAQAQGPDSTNADVQYGNPDGGANPWANAPMSEAAAAGFSGPQAGGPGRTDSGMPPMRQTSGFPAGAVPPQLNPWAQGPDGPMSGGADANPDANPWANAPMSEAAAAGLTGPQAGGHGPHGMGAPGEHAQGQPVWGTPGQPGADGSQGPGPGGQMPSAAPGQEQGAVQPNGSAPDAGAMPGGPGQPADMAAAGHSGVPGQYGVAPGRYGTGAPGPGGAGQPGPSGFGQYGMASAQPGVRGPGTWGASGPSGFAGGSVPSLDDVPMRRAKKAPESGWRRAVHHMSGGAINPGMSAEERRLQELVARIRQPVRGDYRIAVLSLKGGVGKTTTTMGLGSIFSSIRGDRVIAVDANPDFGTLSQRVPLQTRSTVRDLLLDEQIQRYSDVRRHTSQGSSRLEVLASERDPAASEAFSEEEYRAVARILQRFYNIILTDCGTGLMHSAMAGVLDLAHSLVLISSSAIDGARSAAATLDWLSLHGHDHLVRNAVVVINLPRPGAPNVGINQLRDYFLSRCRAVHIIPYDAHLGEGAEIDLHRLSKPAKRAYVELAATVADDFGADHRHYRG
ncbi:AAA family ATPase [Nocardia sp. NPDC004860]|uniref:nucleotide-binding protein n=1 Tax=Nocardia sp. NPDC004860 TaxID=3154557 RepID=UPI0033A6DDA5